MRCAHTMRFGAALDADTARFRLWAPSAHTVELLLHHEGRAAQGVAASARGDGWYEVAHAARAGQRYQWRIDGGLAVPDPASRCNPDGPHAPSALVDPLAFEWDDGWNGRPWHEAVFYQLHIGTWTRAGTFAAAGEHLPELAALGITAVQLMPLADFPGDFGWGYDGVLPFAPYHGYGTPDDLKRFVQAAHRLGLMVFSDVVYNHFGPDGNYLHAYAAPFFTRRHRTAWGDAIDFSHDTVRDFFIENALYWLQEYRLDGLRLDAVHAMVDERQPDILQQLSQRVRAAFPGRHVHLVLENDCNDPARLAAPGTAGLFDGQWSGDLHHALHVLLTGEQHGYYAEYDQPLPQLAQSLSRGFVRQGGPHNAPGAPPRRAAQGQAPLGALVQFLQTHDQIGNRALGERLAVLAEPRALQLAQAIVLLMPSAPLLFMGEDWGARTPFLYFADWHGDLREAVRRGRREEFAHFEDRADATGADPLPDPCSRGTFERCKLDVADVNEPGAAAARAACAELLALRIRHLVPWLPRLAGQGHHAEVQGALLLARWRFERGEGDEGSRWFHLQANLSGGDIGVPPAGPGAEPVHTVGEPREQTLGAWSARWFWQDGPAR